jgi:hypothetical protein
MAERSAVKTPYDDINLFKVTWSGLLNTDTGEGIALQTYMDRTVQLKGTTGTGGAVTMEGSNDGGTTWGALTDPQGNSLVLDAVGEIEAISELPEMIRPRVSAGDGSTNLTVTVFMRGNRQ